LPLIATAAPASVLSAAVCREDDITSDAKAAGPTANFEATPEQAQSYRDMCAWIGNGSGCVSAAC
jgi:hypothetical protein